MASQLLNAATNAATAYVAALLLGPADFGPFAIAFACVTILGATARGLVGSTVLTYLPTAGDDERDLVRSVAGVALTAGLVAAALLGLGAAWDTTLGVFAVWMVPAVLHDTGRHVAFARQQQPVALAMDVVWAVVQGLVLAVCALTDQVSTTTVVAAWGLGSLVGLVPFLLRDRVTPSSPRAWISRTRSTIAWYTGSAALGQIEVYAVILVVGWALTTTEAGGVRAAQLIAAQPMIALLGAMMTQAIPRSAAVLDRPRPGAVRAVVTENAVLVAPVVAVLVGVVLARGPLMDLLLPEFTAFTSLVVPTAAATLAIALSVPAIAVIRGLRLARLEFGVQLGRVVVMLVALPLVLTHGSLEAGLWAAAGAQALGTAALVAAVVRARRSAGPRDG